MIWFTKFEIVEKNLVQLIVVILASMHERQIEMPIDCLNHAGQADNLWPRTDNDGYLHFFHCSTGTQ